MDRALQVIHDWLTHRYRELGFSLASEGSSGPLMWRWLDETRSEIADAEIGVVTRFSAIADTEHLSRNFQKDIRWALDTASRLEYRSGIPRDKADPLGAWQVQVVWIVSASCKSGWLASMSELRAKSAYAEEIGLDLIDLAGTTIEESLANEGIPVLMLEARKLLRKQSDEMPEWISPDAEFEARLSNMAKGIADREQRSFAASFLENVRSKIGERESVGPSFAPRLGRLRVSNVRNIEHAELAIEPSSAAQVIHGPNGTGKSSLFEAVSFALLGTSKRHCEFLEDKDVLPTSKANYAGQVLKRFDSKDNEPASIVVDGRELLDAVDSDVESVRARLVVGRGTLLAQESAREFLAMSASELAAFVLGDYSPAARRVQSIVDSGAQVAKTEWQDWLRSYGLNASITKSGTILRRLVGKVVQDECPPEAQNPLGWLRSLGERFERFADSTRLARAAWEDLDSPSSRDAIVELTAAAVEKSGAAERPIANWLSERARVSQQVIDLLSTSDNFLEPIRSNWLEVKADLLHWSRWLMTSADRARSAPAGAPVSSDFQRTEEIRVRLEVLAPLGKELRARRDHLATVVDSVLTAWAHRNIHICPTCDATHERPIIDVVKQIQASTEREYSEIRAEFASLSAEMTSIREQSVTPDDNCPVAPERQAQISSFLEVAVQGPTSLEVSLASDQGRNELIASFEKLLSVPKWKQPQAEESIVSQSKELSLKIIEARAEGIDRQELPIRWDLLKKEVDLIALEVVSTHLPKTIGKLWHEFSRILAPANWIQVCNPKMSMELKRGSERLSVVVRRDRGQLELPARHVLNQAEQHVLGLAWFFTRFLTHGRFLAPFLALDDPAQEMDQVTFRKFVRFIQAFQRTHAFLAKKVGILVFLHQEERALDLARAVSENGTLTVLDWSREVQSIGPQSTVREFQLRNGEQVAPSYMGLLAHPEAASA